MSTLTHGQWQFRGCAGRVDRAVCGMLATPVSVSNCVAERERSDELGHLVTGELLTMQAPICAPTHYLAPPPADL